MFSIKGFQTCRSKLPDELKTPQPDWKILCFKVKPKVTRKRSNEEADGEMDIGYVDEVEVKKQVQ